VTRCSFWSGWTARGSSSAMGNSGEAATGTEQSSEERGRTSEETKRSGRQLPW
jgi:hypothetical protein